MKKTNTPALKTLLMLLFCAMSTIATAQQYVGFKAGFTVSNSEFDFGIEDYDLTGKGAPRPAFMLFSEFDINSYYTFAPNIHFSQTGNLMSRPDSIYSGTFNRIDYIGTGLINKVKLFSDEFEVYGLVGPQFRWAIGGRTRHIAAPSRNLLNIVEKIDFEAIDLKRFDINMHTGIGLSKVNPGYKIILEWTYDIPLFDVNSSKPFTQRNHRNTGVLLGLMFELNRED